MQCIQFQLCTDAGFEAWQSLRNAEDCAVLVNSDISFHTHKNDNNSYFAAVIPIQMYVGWHQTHQEINCLFTVTIISRVTSLVKLLHLLRTTESSFLEMKIPKNFFHSLYSILSLWMSRFNILHSALYYTTLLNLYSAIVCVKHESKHCDSDEPS